MKKGFGKKVTAFFLVSAIAAGVLTACSSKTDSSGSTGIQSEQTEAQGAGKKTKVTVALAKAINVFSPYTKWDPYIGIQYAGVYERLGEREQFGSENFKGVLMEKWEQENDTTYRCYLYDYITDSQGNPFTANDVKFSVNKCHEAGMPDAKYIEDIEVINDYEFVMHLTDSGLGVFEMVCETCWMATEASYEKAAAEDSICPGTGPYVCTNFISGSTTTVEKRDDYWQKEELTAVTSRANVDVIVYNIVSEATQMAIAMENTNVTQMFAWLTESIIEDAKRIDGITVESKPSIQMKSIVFNSSEYSACQNEALRKAVSYAINNEALIQTALSGVGYVPKTFGSSYAIGYNEKWEESDYYSYNVEKAKELLNEAGFKEGELTLQFYGAAGAETEKTGTVLASCLEAIGIKCQVNSVEAATQSAYLNDLASGWDIFLAGTTLKGPYLIQTYSYYCSNVGYNNQANGPGWGVYDPEFQALIDKCNSKEAAQEDLDQVHDYVVDHCYVYQWFNNYYTCAHVNSITETVTNFKNNLVTGACTYTDDYAFYAD